jgi:hypothetical protein
MENDKAISLFMQDREETEKQLKDTYKEYPDLLYQDIPSWKHLSKHLGA